MEFKPCFLATAIGSTPHKEAAKAIEQVFSNFKQIPFWPQLPKRSFLESMYVQFSEKLPGVLINEEKRTIHLNTEQAGKQLEECYEHYLSDDSDYFAITPEYAQGFYTLLERLAEDERRTTNDERRYIKGQITGPISFGLTVTDENKRSIIYNSLLAEVLIKVLVMKAKWQIRKLKAQSSPKESLRLPTGQAELKAIMFIDEPYLSSVGSAYVNLKREDIIKYCDEVIEAIHAEDALAGIHCCGNTDWSIVLDTKTDIVSFDAYNFIDNFSVYTEKLKNFLAQGGVLAWGIVPASEAIDKESVVTLKARLERGIDSLVEKGLPEKEIAERALITPSCGAGTLSIEAAERTFELTRRISDFFCRK